MSAFSSLNRSQKEAIGLLQVGTFLEYFDLMLYVHMAVLLNELFFPKTDPHTTALLSAFAFCSTFVLRPFGALIFGWIGDNIGRKTTVIITTLFMSVSCMVMANLPIYAQIGITATWTVTLCRIIQGLSSMGEIMGAQIYVTEITKPPAQYIAVSFVSIASAFGSMAALGIASLVTHFQFNWRLAFWMGAAIAVIGSVARIRLRETPEFIKMKIRKIKKQQENTWDKNLEDTWGKWRTSAAYFFVFCGWPLTFYISYMYFNPTLKELCHYTSEDMIFHNFLLSITLCVSSISWTCLATKMHPIKITKLKGRIGFVSALVLPFLISVANTPLSIFAIQVLLLNFTLGETPSFAIFIKHFPTLKRFTLTSFLYALTRAMMYIVTSFGLVYLTGSLGHWGIWVVMIPVTTGFLWGIHHFEKLENLNKTLNMKHSTLKTA
ncbi:MFS transporter [Candidatus Paracaedibacter symbiosus]|uniref:MFS transporter n=1 Tax=Candidatus Paracaedibacter symbiosus TaxID=244582 RepID=UPI000509A865|nr:MFS transporter [Candidatus Paracaedibacter symbiosus]